MWCFYFIVLFMICIVEFVTNMELYQISWVSDESRTHDLTYAVGFFDNWTLQGNPREVSHKILHVVNGGVPRFGLYDVDYLNVRTRELSLCLSKLRWIQGIVSRQYAFVLQQTLKFQLDWPKWHQSGPRCPALIITMLYNSTNIEAPILCKICFLFSS